MRITDAIRRRVVANTTSLFSHAEYPLARTLDHRGDPGLFGPDSATWPVIGDVAAFFGGIRALLVQAAHPEVSAGVADHSRYREDPLGRLSRTSAYVTATSFGAKPEVDAAVEVVKRAHRRVTGVSHRGNSYTADAPPLAAWVHNALTDSFLTAYQRFARQPLSQSDADRFVSEQAKVGALLYSDPLPGTARDLSAWIAQHPHLGPSPGTEDAIKFLRSPPLPWNVKPAYRLLFWAASATLPRRLRRILGLRRIPGAITVGKIASRGLRWALGSSPSWQIALVRTGAPIPPGLFHQRLAPEVQAMVDSGE